MSKTIPTNEAPTWKDVPYLETTDRVIGGIAGSSNASALALHERTEYLKEVIEGISQGTGTALTDLYSDMDMHGNTFTSIRDAVVVDEPVTLGQLGNTGTNQGADLVGFLQLGAGAVARTSQDKSREVISVTDFGAIGDGTTDNLIAFTTAFAASAGKKLRIPAGNYRIPFSAATALTPPANIVIEGDGRDNTTITFVPSNTTFKTFFGLSAGGFTLIGVKTTQTAPSTAQTSIFALSSSGLTVEDCDLDGGVTNSGATLSHACWGLVIASSGTQNDIVFRRNTIRRQTYPYLKTNESVSEQRRIEYIGNDFNSNYYNDLGINSPNGICDDVLIEGNKFRNNLSTVSIGDTQALGLALASVTNFRVIGNHFQDAYTDAVHMEESCAFGVVTGNTFNVDGSAIAFNANLVGGVETRPENIVISGNTIKKQGTIREVGKYAIRLIFNTRSELPAKNLIIADNIVSLFYYGLWSVSGAQEAPGLDVPNECIIVKDNLFDKCSIGMGLFDGTLTVQGNVTSECVIGISATESARITETAVVESHTFIDCTTNVDSIDRTITLIDPMFVLPEFDHAGGSISIYKPLLRMAVSEASRAHGYFEVVADASGNVGSSRARDEVTWDGTTFTRTNKLLLTVGGIQAQSAADSNYLAVSVFASIPLTGIRMNVRFNGMFVHA